jgi:LL-diaminopimelate aminotransferase
MVITIEPAGRLTHLPPTYVFGRVARAKKAALDAGLSVIDFGIGDPDRGTPQSIIDSMCQHAQYAANHRYPDTEGTIEYREAWARFYLNEWGVTLDPDGEVHSLIGGKEGIGHIALALVNPGDIVICPDPGYPVYDEGTILAGGVPYYVELSAENDFLPDFESIPSDVAQRAKIFWINSPNNPTGAVASLAYFEALAEWARRHNIIICSDATYSHIGSNIPAPSFMQATGAKDIGVEFHSVSKTLCATGFRLGVVVGNTQIIAALHRVKASLDSGQARFIELAFAGHLLDCDDHIRSWNQDLTRMRGLLQDALRLLDFIPVETGATFYTWAKLPEGFTDSEAFAYDLIEKTGVVCVPGKGLGRQHGEGYVRFSLAAATPEDISVAGPLMRDFIAAHR